MKRGLPVLLLAVMPLLLGVGLYLLLRPEPSDEDQIRQAIQTVAEGARKGDLGTTLKPISRAYQDEDELNFDAIRGYLFREFQRRNTLSVILGPITVAIEPDGIEATAEFDAALAEGVDVTSFELIPTEADALHFWVELQKEGEDWKVLSHTRERIR